MRTRTLNPNPTCARPLQAESIWFHLPIIKSLAAMCGSIFVGGSVSYAFTTIPTYPSGQIGFMLCSKAREGAPIDPRVARQTPGTVVPPLGDKALQYYDAAVHQAAFVIPKFAREAIGEHLTFKQ